MSESKHTAGPWDIHIRKTTAGDCGAGIWIQGANHKTVVDTGAMDSWPLSEANARLIATAPDLLAACKALLAEFNCYSDAMTKIGRGHEDYGGQREAARIAIARAEKA